MGHLMHKGTLPCYSCVQLRRDGDAVDRDLTLTGDVRMPAGGIVVQPPGDAPLRAVVVNGAPTTRFTDTQATIEELPAKVRLIRGDTPR